MTQERPPFFSKGQNGLKVEGRFQLLKLKNDVSAGKNPLFSHALGTKKGPQFPILSIRKLFNSKQLSCQNKSAKQSYTPKLNSRV